MINSCQSYGKQIIQWFLNWPNKFRPINHIVSHSWNAKLIRNAHLYVEMPLRGHQHHQFAEQLGKRHHPQVFAEQLQAAQAADSPAGRGARISRHQRNWKIDSSQDPRGQAEAQSGSLQGPSRLAGDPQPLPWLRVAKLFHQNPGGWSEGPDQATVCGSDPKSCKRKGAGIAWQEKWKKQWTGNYEHAR